MRKNYKQPSIVSGKSIQDIMNMDISTFNKLGTSDMRKVVGRLVSAGNKRLRSFERVGENSPAVRQLMKSGGPLSTRGKNLNALRSEYVRAKNFLQSKTGTRAGWKKVVKETINTLKEEGIDITREQFDDIWTAYEDLKELDPEVTTKKLRYAILKEISNLLVDKKLTPEEIAINLHNKLTLIYEEKEKLKNDENGVSVFFEW